MIQISIDDNYLPTILQNDRGEWRMGDTDPASGVLILIGFSGENIVTVQWSAMQSRRTNVFLTHHSCDGPIEFWSETRDVGWGVAELAAFVNDGLRSLLNYPERL